MISLNLFVKGVKQAYRKSFAYSILIGMGILNMNQVLVAQTISLPTAGVAYTQNFNSLGSTAGSTTNNLTITGWYLTEAGGGARDNEQYGVDNGASNTGDTYSYGTTAAADRALGYLRSGTLISTIGAAFTNNMGASMSAVEIGYAGEEWRLGTAGRADQLTFEYSIDATDLTTGTWIGVSALNFVTPDQATVGAKNGNAAADRTVLTATITGLAIPNGSTIWIRWTDPDATSADDGLAVDDFTLTPRMAVVTAPEIDLQGNSVSITNGSTVPSLTDHSSFGSQSVCSGIISRTFSILNTGSAALNLTGTPRVSVSGVNAADYTVTTQPSASISAGGNSTFVVEFDPSAAGVRSATLTIDNNDADENPYSFSINGTGVDVTAILNSLSNISCHGSNDGAISVTANGVGTLTYDWAPGTPNGDGTSSVSGLSSGDYTLTVADVNACQTMSVFTISEPAALNLTISNTDPAICAGNTTTLNAVVSGGSGVATYTWNSGASTGSLVVAPSVTSTYTLDISDANNCTTSQTVSVVVNALPVISVNSGSICAGQSFTLIPNGANTYTYSGGSAIVNPGSTTTYSVSGTSIDGCVSTMDAISIVTVNTLPVISVNSGSVCAGQSFTIVPNGATTYTYSGGSAIVNPASTTSYSITGTSANGCVSAQVISTVTVSALPVISVNSGSVCAGQSFTIVPNGATTYTYSGGSAIVNPTSTASYSITGTSANGCVSAQVISTVTVNALPAITVNSGSVCAGQSFTLIPNGASTYTYSGGSAIVNPMSTTSYSVSGTSSAGCKSSTNAVSTVTVNALPVISVNSGSVCAGQSFTLMPTGATTYTFSGGSAIVNPASTTSYSITGTSANSCVSAQVISTVTVNVLPVITVNSGSVCAGQSFTIVPNGATTYTYSGGSAIVNPTSTASYSITGTGANGCVSAQVISTVTVNALPVITVNSGSVCAGQSFTLIPNGASTYTYSGGSAIVNPMSTTSYSVSGTSSAGCKNITDAVSTITVNALPVISVNSGSVCAGQSFTLIPNGASTYTYSGGSAIVNPASTASYSITGTSANGCVSAQVISTVTVSALPVISVNSGSVCAGQSFTIVPNGATTYTYSGGSAIVNPTSTASYSITGTSANGCVSAQVISTVTVNALPVITVNSGSVCAGQSFTLIPNGASTYTYSGGSAIVNPMSTTSYSVSGTSSAGCKNITDAVSTITVNALPVISVNSGSVCAGQSFTIVPNGATTYTFSGGSAMVNPTSTTSYSVTGTSANGCVSAQVISTVTVNALPPLSINMSNTIICTGETASLTAVGATTYTWSTTQVSAGIAVSPTVTTGYSVTGSDVNGCMNTASSTLSVSLCTGISENNTRVQSFVVYPNPSSGEYTIDLQAQTQMEVYDLLGHLIYQEKLQEGKNRIYLNDYADGIYMMKLSVEGKESIIKLIKH